MGIIYKNQNKYELAEIYYKIIIEKNYNYEIAIAMNGLGIIYEEQGKYELAEKYYLMAVEKNNDNAIYNIGDFYCEQNKYILAEKYYLMIIEKDKSCVIPYHNLGNLYYKWNKYELAKDYYSIAIEKGCIDSISILAKLCNPLELYYILTNRMTKNKKRNLSKVYECTICLENTNVIPRECAHYYCYSCYVKIDKCVICKS